MKLSIITINRNNASGLRKTIDSVLKQSCRDFEYIIVDGASTDESVDIIRASALQAEGLDFAWKSEPDTGIYNAMNKGLKMSHGEYTLMLNSGDYLVDEQVIERIMPKLDGTDIIQGKIIENSDGILYRNRGYGKSDIDMNDVMHGHFLHQAAFCRRDLFERFGYFDESYRLAGDTKFFMNCLGKHDASFQYVDIDIANYDLTGISAETRGAWKDRKDEENNRLRKELFSRREEEYVMGNEKKIRLYDKLHTHRWIWNLTMAIAHIHNWIYGEQPVGEEREKCSDK